MSDMLPTPHPVEAIDTVAREKAAGVRAELHEFREEIKTDVAQLRQEISHGFSKVFSHMDSETRANLQSSKSGLGVIASFSLGVIGLAFSFTTLVTEPLKDRDQRHDADIAKQYDLLYQRLIDAASDNKQLGNLATRAEANAQRISELRDQVTTLNQQALSNTATSSRLSGQMDALLRQVDAIDSGGSRKHLPEPHAE